jgi:hypothetical protein
MAVTKVTEDWRALGVNTEVSLSGESGSMTRRFVVDFNAADDPASRPILALAASAGGVSIPDYWAAHPISSDYFVRRKSAVPDGGPTSFAVAVEYEYIQNPLLQHYSVQFVPQSTQEAIDRAVDPADPNQALTKELCNSSKEPFDPPIQEEFYDFSIVIKRNEANFPILTVGQYLNTVNSDAFQFFANNGVLYSFPAGTTRCRSIQADEQRHGPVWYFAVSYEFVVRNDGWKRRIMDQGFRVLDGTDYKQVADVDGNPVTQPVKLNGSGVQLAASAAPVFLEFQTKKTKAFSAFNFFW